MDEKEAEARPVIGRAKRAPHWGVQSRFRVIYIYVTGSEKRGHLRAICTIEIQTK